MPSTTKGITEMLNHFFGQQAAIAIGSPDTLYVGLATVVFTSATIDSAACNEVTGGSYARIAITNNDGDATEWATVTTGTLLTSNTNPVVFVESTAAWGTVKTVFLSNVLSGAGSIFWYKNLTTPVVVGDNTIVTIAAGDLQVSMA